MAIIAALFVGAVLGWFGAMILLHNDRVKEDAAARSRQPAEGER